MKTKFTTITLIVAALTFTMGCKKFVDVGPPKTELITSSAFSNDNSATSAVLGIYNKMQADADLINGGVTITAGLASDELIPYFDDQTLVQFQTNLLTPANGKVYSIWSNAFNSIVQINTCITGLENNTALTPAVKAQLLGEAKFCRAYYNFYLVNLFGNVPLVFTTDYIKNSAIAQSKATDVYAAITTDLKEAQALMVDAYPTEGRVRPNKAAATALLARVYLYTNDYVNAEAQSSAVINSGLYGPLPALSDAFLKDSKEAIWQLLPGLNYSASQEATSFLADIAYGYADYYLTDNLANSFEPGDNRKTTWIDTITFDNKLHYYPFKYKDYGSYLPATINENYIMLRLGEQYLIRAEARAQLGKVNDALTDLNVIRTRAGLGNISLIDKNDLLTAIANENRHEFVAEWGHRWLDLKRTGKADAILSAQKTTWKSTAVYFPIPQQDINLNKNLVQNPGY